jgi:hypothetical protein
MERGFWGPSIWNFIHLTAITYKPTDRLSYKNFIYSLPQLLPCENCCKHLSANLKTLPIDNSLDNSSNLFIWTYNLHDLVNKQLNKKPSPPLNITIEYYKSKVNDLEYILHHMWRMIHSIAATYRTCTDSKNAFKQFIYSIVNIIPNSNYQKIYSGSLSLIPLSDDYMKNADNLFLWSYLVEDLCNRSLNKIMTPYDKIREIYFNKNVCNTCS